MTADWNHGDIIRYTAPDGREVTRVLIRVHRRYATALLLFDEEQRENEYIVNAGHQMHADLGKITYLREAVLDEAELIREMKDEEYDDLMGNIAEALGIPILPEYEDSEEKERNNSELEALRKENEGLRRSLEEIKPPKEDPMPEIAPWNPSRFDAELRIARLETERDTYKALYIGLLEKAVRIA